MWEVVLIHLLVERSLACEGVVILSALPRAEKANWADLPEYREHKRFPPALAKKCRFRLQSEAMLR